MPGIQRQDNSKINSEIIGHFNVSRSHKHRNSVGFFRSISYDVPIEIRRRSVEKKYQSLKKPGQTSPLRKDYGAKNLAKNKQQNLRNSLSLGLDQKIRETCMPSLPDEIY
ncbi:hypothetical protein ACFRAE_07340 [Sphingobacterium sp. HJSM2_6]|uniref:hypothetical protein n=1 Tax=Sphingobacterium sp. HJSM2_6 TaxID=3366264 RepID=UPI003BC04371